MISAASSNGKNPPSALSRSATRSGPTWDAREPARKKHPRMVAPVVSVKAASTRRFSIRNSDTSGGPIGPRGAKLSHQPICLDIYSVSGDPMGFTPTDTIWFNGQLVPWADAQVHVLAHGLHYGTGVFEGMRCYPTVDGPAVFRLDVHLERFYASAAIYDLEIPYTQDRLTAATHELIRANRLESAYLRPIAFFDAAPLSVWTRPCPVTGASAGFPTGAYHAGGPDHGVRVTISPVRKFDNSDIPAWAKACGQYINSARAVNEAQRRGFDEAIPLNSQRLVAEGSGENLLVAKWGALVTTDKHAGILMGVTRASILEIARDLDLPTRVAPISIEDMLGADELFVSGTAVEVTPIREVDGRAIGDGKPGPITRRLQQTFNEVVRGQRAEYRKWLSFVRQPVTS